MPDSLVVKSIFILYSTKVNQNKGCYFNKLFCNKSKRAKNDTKKKTSLTFNRRILIGNLLLRFHCFSFKRNLTITSS